MVDLRLGDCLEVLKTIPAGSVDAVITDPPYGIGKAEWDKFSVEWIPLAIRASKRQAAFWCFHSDPIRLVEVASVFASSGKKMLSWITWDKYAPDQAHSQLYAVRDAPGLRSFAQLAEYAIYCADDGAWDSQTDELRGFLFEPLRAYLEGEWTRAGLTRKDADAATGSFMSGHYLSRVQWALPTREKYEQLRAYANSRGGGGEYLRREYEDLRREYEDLRREYEDLRREYESLRPTFNTPGGVSSVWRFPPAAPNGHETPKPVQLMRRIVETTTRPGDMILDPFMGSGTTGVACVETGRSFIGVEIDPGYLAISKKRIDEAQSQMRMDL